MLIRLQNKIEGLVDEMLDKIPTKYFKSSTATFLDPAMGSGQFVSAIENKLREHGHSDENIAGRVFGLEQSWRVQIAVNRYNLVGTYEIADFIEDDVLMKFDVTVGNPPFQRADSTSHKLWVRFLTKALEISEVVAFVSPKIVSQLLNGQEINQVTLRDDVNVLFYNGYDVNEHFSVGSTFCYYVVSKKYTPIMKIVIDGEIQEWPQGSYIPFADMDPMVSDIVTKTCSFTNEYGRSAARVPPVKHGRGRFDCIEFIRKAGPVWCTSAKEHADTYKYKMIYPTLGPGEYVDDVGCVMPASSFVPYITTNTKKELKELVKLQNSNVFQFLCLKGFNGMRSPRDYVWKSIKKGDFNLTKEELEYIDNNVE